jgi:putative tryptophan/tyrosine transport system substrate-binding protein
MQRREFIAGLGAAAWPLAARAQQPEQIRRIGVLVGPAASDPEVQRWLAAFVQGLDNTGWVEGRNLRIDYRFAAGDADLTRTHVADLLGLAPDLIFADGTPVLSALRQATRTRPIVFVNVNDPPKPVLSRTLPGRAATSPGLVVLNTRQAQNWWSCSRQFRPDFRMS